VRLGSLWVMEQFRALVVTIPLFENIVFSKGKVSFKKKKI
jgi:hypothetical protein